jgi:hypothetical protein
MRARGVTAPTSAYETNQGRSGATIGQTSPRRDGDALQRDGARRRHQNGRQGELDLGEHV